MKTVSMSGSLRENVGKKDAKVLRREGKVPCVIYGGKEQIHFAVQNLEFKPLVFCPDAAFVDINIDGTNHKAILQDIQFHPVGDEIIHADFYEFDEKSEITMSIPVLIEGVSPGVLKGGKMISKFRKLKVKALPGNMPEKIIVNISKLDINDTLHVKDVSADNFSILLPGNTILVSVATTRAVKGDAADAATPAEAEKK